MKAPGASFDAVVLTWRESEQTTACVTRLLDSAVSRIWLVDNQSTGGVRHLADLDDRVVLVEVAENRGFAGGVNLGLRASLDTAAPYVLCINNDAHIAGDDVDALIRALEDDPRLGAVAPRLVFHGERADVPTFSSPRMKVMSADDVTHVSFLTWACVLLRKETLREIGLLDEAFFMYWEDVDFGRRLREHGHTMRIVPGSEATHAEAASHVEAGPLIALYSAHGMVVEARKIGLQALPAVLLRAAARVVRALLRGDADRARHIARGIAIGARSDLSQPAHVTLAPLSERRD